jgi:hypothetical protein
VHLEHLEDQLVLEDHPDLLHHLDQEDQGDLPVSLELYIQLYTVLREKQRLESDAEPSG